MHKYTKVCQEPRWAGLLNEVMHRLQYTKRMVCHKSSKHTLVSNTVILDWFLFRTQMATRHSAKSGAFFYLRLSCFSMLSINSPEQTGDQFWVATDQLRTTVLIKYTVMFLTFLFWTWILNRGNGEKLHS